MIRMIIRLFVGIVLVALCVAILNAFNWDIGAVFAWAWNFILGIINAIAGFFTGNPLFQKAVSSN